MKPLFNVSQIMKKSILPLFSMVGFCVFVLLAKAFLRPATFRILLNIVSILIILLTMGVTLLKFRNERQFTCTSQVLAIFFPLLTFIVFSLVFTKLGQSFLYFSILSGAIGLALGAFWSRTLTLSLKKKQVWGKQSGLWLVFWGASFMATQITVLLNKKAMFNYSIILMAFTTGIAVGMGLIIIKKIRMLNKQGLAPGKLIIFFFLMYPFFFPTLTVHAKTMVKWQHDPLNPKTITAGKPYSVSFVLQWENIDGPVPYEIYTATAGVKSPGVLLKVEEANTIHSKGTFTGTGSKRITFNLDGMPIWTPNGYPRTFQSVGVRAHYKTSKHWDKWSKSYASHAIKFTNSQPQVKLTCDAPFAPNSDLTRLVQEGGIVSIDASDSIDPDGHKIITYHWYVSQMQGGRSHYVFGSSDEPRISTLPVIQHAFPKTGSYYITVIPVDEHGGGMKYGELPQGVYGTGKYVWGYQHPTKMVFFKANPPFFINFRASRSSYIPGMIAGGEGVLKNWKEEAISGAHVNVAVKDTNGKEISRRESKPLITDSLGKFTWKGLLPQNALPGNWTLTLKAAKNNEILVDGADFPIVIKAAQKNVQTSGSKGLVPTAKTGADKGKNEFSDEEFNNYVAGVSALGGGVAGLGALFFMFMNGFFSPGGSGLFSNKPEASTTEDFDDDISFQMSEPDPIELSPLETKQEWTKTGYESLGEHEETTIQKRYRQNLNMHYEQMNSHHELMENVYLAGEGGSKIILYLADKGVDILGGVTGPTGEGIKDTYNFTKSFAGTIAENLSQGRDAGIGTAVVNGITNVLLELGKDYTIDKFGIPGAESKNWQSMNFKQLTKVKNKNLWNSMGRGGVNSLISSEIGDRMINVGKDPVQFSKDVSQSIKDKWAWLTAENENVDVSLDAIDTGPDQAGPAEMVW